MVKSADPSLPAGVWAAPAPPLPPSSGGAARHLFVEGVRATRTRVNITTPNGHQTPAGASWDLPRLSLEQHRADCPACSYTVNSTVPLHWANPMDVEFVHPVGMSKPRCTINQVEAGGNGTTRLEMKQPCLHNLVNRDWQPVGKILPVLVENVRAHLTTPAGSSTTIGSGSSSCTTRCLARTWPPCFWCWRWRRCWSSTLRRGTTSGPT